MSFIYETPCIDCIPISGSTQVVTTGCGPQIEVEDTSTIDLVGSGNNCSPLKANLIISEAAGNSIQVLDDGVYASDGTGGGGTVNTENTPSLSLSGDGSVGNPLSGDVEISELEGNLLVIENDGLFVSAQTDPFELSGVTVTERTAYPVDIEQVSDANVFLGAHGTLALNDQFYIGSRNTSNFVVFTDPSDLSLYDQYEISTFESICYNESVDRIFGIQETSSTTFDIYEIDPADPSSFVVHNLSGLGVNISPAIISVGNYIYGVTYGNPAVFFKINITSWTIELTNTWTGARSGHAAGFVEYTDRIELYFSTAWSPAKFAKVNPTDLTYTEVETDISTATDDLAIRLVDNNGSIVYLGGEATGGSTAVDTASMTYQTFAAKPSYAMAIVGTDLYNLAIEGGIEVFPAFDLDNPIYYPTEGYIPNELLVTSGGDTFFTSWSEAEYGNVLVQFSLLPSEQKFDYDFDGDITADNLTARDTVESDRVRTTIAEFGTPVPYIESIGGNPRIQFNTNESEFRIFQNGTWYNLIPDLQSVLDKGNEAVTGGMTLYDFSENERFYLSTEDGVLRLVNPDSSTFFNVSKSSNTLEFSVDDGTDSANFKVSKDSGLEFSFNNSNPASSSVQINDSLFIEIGAGTDQSSMNLSSAAMTLIFDGDPYDTTLTVSQTSGMVLETSNAIYQGQASFGADSISLYVQDSGSNYSNIGMSPEFMFLDSPALEIYSQSLLVSQLAGTGTRMVVADDSGYLGVQSIPSGSTVSFGTDNQIPFVNSAGNDFEYSSGITFDGSTLILNGVTPDNTVSLHTNGGIRSDVVTANGRGFHVDMSAGDGTAYYARVDDQDYILRADTGVASRQFFIQSFISGSQFIIQTTNAPLTIKGASGSVTLTTDASQNIIVQASGSFVVNESGANTDTRIEGDTDQNLVFVDASLDAVGLGAGTIDASAKVQIDSTTKGFLPPRMTEAQKNAISSPAEGLLIYQTDGTKGWYGYNGSSWVSL